MKPSELLFKAAKLQFRFKRRYGACYSLVLVSSQHGNLEYTAAARYLRLFSPKRDSVNYWFGIPARCDKQQRTQRQLALLFASEIARSEGQ